MTYKHRIAKNSQALAHINIKNGEPESDQDRIILRNMKAKYGKIRLYYNGPRSYRKTGPGHSYYGPTKGGQRPTKCLKKDAYGASIYQEI